MKTSLLILLFSLTVLYACTKEENRANPQSSLPDVQLKNGYLEFKNQAVFDKTLQDLAGKDEAYLTNWEKQFGFTSMQTLYKQVIASEIAKNEAFDKLPEADKYLAENQNKLRELTPFTQGHRKMLVIDKEGIIDMNIHSDNVAFVVNEAGVVKIGKFLYKFSADDVRVVTNGDESKLETLSKYNKTDEGQHVFVSKILSSRRNKESGRVGPFTNSCDARTGNCNNCKRVIGYEENTTYFGPSYNINTEQPNYSRFVYRHEYLIKVRSLRRNWVGSWVDQDATLTAEGYYNYTWFTNTGRVNYSVSGGGSTFTHYFTIITNFTGSYDSWGNPILTNDGTCCNFAIDVIESSHTVTGANGVTCTTGETI